VAGPPGCAPSTSASPGGPTASRCRGWCDQDFADAGRRLDELNDRRFTAFGLSAREIAELRERFAIWPRA